MDRGAWQATVHGVTKSRMWLKRLSTSEARVLGCQGLSLVDRFSLFCLCRKSSYELSTVV